MPGLVSRTVAGKIADLVRVVWAKNDWYLYLIDWLLVSPSSCVLLRELCLADMTGVNIAELACVLEVSYICIGVQASSKGVILLLKSSSGLL